jgi:cell division transport system permease protein
VRINFFLKEALESLRRNWVMTVASVLTVFISMAIFGLVVVARYNLDRGTASLKNRVMIEIFIKNDATPAQQDALETKIKGMSEVKSYEYVSKDQALAEFKKRLGPDADQILANLPTNPLPASFRVQVKDANQVDTVAARFFNDPNVDNDPGTTNGVKYAKQTVRKMLGTIRIVETGAWVTTVLIAAAAVLLVSTTVRLSIFARRRELEIMQLVGATNWFIRWPFVLEGFITGFVGAALAAAGVWGLNWFVASWVQNSNVKFLDPQVVPAWWGPVFSWWHLGLVLTLVLTGAALGAIGSAVALVRHLRV